MLGLLKGLFLSCMHLFSVPYLWGRQQPGLREHPVMGGVFALPQTPAAEIVMVKLNYARGWRFPGGGREAGQNPEAAVLKELREEIGLTGHGEMERLEESDRSFLFLVRDVAFSVPSWSIECAMCAHSLPRTCPATWKRGRASS